MTQVRWNISLNCENCNHPYHLSDTILKFLPSRNNHVQCTRKCIFTNIFCMTHPAFSSCFKFWYNSATFPSLSTRPANSTCRLEWMAFILFVHIDSKLWPPENGQSSRFTMQERKHYQTASKWLITVSWPGEGLSHYLTLVITLPVVGFGICSSITDFCLLAGGGAISLLLSHYL